MFIGQPPKSTTSTFSGRGLSGMLNTKKPSVANAISVTSVVKPLTAVPPTPMLVIAFSHSRVTVPTIHDGFQANPAVSSHKYFLNSLSSWDSVPHMLSHLASQTDLPVHPQLRSVYSSNSNTPTKEKQRAAESSQDLVSTGYNK